MLGNGIEGYKPVFRVGEYAIVDGNSPSEGMVERRVGCEGSFLLIVNMDTVLLPAFTVKRY